MGNCCTVEGAIDHWIYVKTGDRKGSGTDANLRAILFDNKGNQSPEIRLDCLFNSDFERGKSDVFEAPPLGKDFGEVILVELWRENAGASADWFCEVLIVNDRRTNRCYYFPVQRWVKAQTHYKIQLFDTMLPQVDPNRDQRQEELKEERLDYAYSQITPEIPVQVRDLPSNEVFSDNSKWDFLANKVNLLSKAGVRRTTVSPWNNMQEVLDFFQTNQTLPAPLNIAEWASDSNFGAQRIIGCNPITIRLCTAIPENMGVTADMLKPYLEGWTLKQVIDAKRLFMVDLKILENLPTKDDNPLCAPIGLFFVSGDKEILPIAIQLHQDLAPDNPVFVPSDPPFTWILAKMWFNNAEAAVHQVVSHFGYTHLLMEGVYVAMHRQLSPSHPVYKLLAPFLLFLPAVNEGGINKMMARGGWIDKCFNLGREGMIELMIRGIDEWRLDRHGCFPKELETRGVYDSRILPFYPYRDDGMLLYKCIDGYVNKILRYYYDDKAKIKEDNELQNWVLELVTAKDQGGVGLKGVPGNGRFSGHDEMALMCTWIIFTCTAQHAVFNNPQYEEYAYPPNYPSYLAGYPPHDKSPKGEEHLVAALPDRDRSMDTIAATKLMTSVRVKPIGEWEFQYQFDPYSLKAEREFREELVRISSVIKQRNFDRPLNYRYPYLDPQGIPNFIAA